MRETVKTATQDNSVMWKPQTKQKCTIILGKMTYPKANMR